MYFAELNQSKDCIAVLKRWTDVQRLAQEHGSTESTRERRHREKVIPCPVVPFDYVLSAEQIQKEPRPNHCEAPGRELLRTQKANTFDQLTVKQ